jgi:dsRNA-specific ribonuclease
VLADVVESVFGAVFLDSGMRMCVVDAVFKRMFWPTVGIRLAHPPN